MIRPQGFLLLLVLVGFCAAIETDRLRAKRAAPDFTVGNFNPRSPIPYILDSRYDATKKNAVLATLKTFSDNTCLDFKEDNSAKVKLVYHLDTTRSSCAADIGDTDYQVYNITVYLVEGCYHTVAIQHETLHALGFRHTQVRADRDKYVKVGEVVKSNSNYRKLNVEANTTDYGIPYEFNSLLHYPPSGNLSAIDPDYGRTLGGSFMIFNDWKMVNMHFKCVDKCTTKIACKNGGYQHPRRCSKCVCPRFHSGTLCEVEKNVISLTKGVPKQLDFGWPYNNDLWNNQELAKNMEQYPTSPATIIKSPVGTRIRVNVLNVKDYLGENYVPQSCDTRALEIVDGGDLTRVGKRFCHKTDNGRSFVSETNVLGYLVFARPGLDFVANVTFTVV